MDAHKRMEKQTQALVGQFVMKCQPFMTQFMEDLIIDMTYHNINFIAELSQDEIIEYWKDCKKHSDILNEEFKENKNKKNDATFSRRKN